MLLIDNMEKIGDVIKRITRQYPHIRKEDKYKEGLYNLLKNLNILYIDCMKAYRTSDDKLAFQINSGKDVVLKDHNQFLNHYSDPKTARICEYLNSMLVYIRNITRSIYQ